MVFPSPRYFNNMVHRTLISTYPVIIDDVITSNKIYVPNIYPPKGKMVRRQPTPVVMDYTVVPQEVMK